MPLSNVNILAVNKELDPNIYMHTDAIESAERYGFGAEVISVIFLDSWLRLRKTGGSKLKKLSGTVGNDWRLRIGNLRAVASLSHDINGRKNVFIHQIDQRRDIYETDTFRKSIENFWHEASTRTGAVDPNVFKKKYRLINPKLAEENKIPKASLEYHFSQMQQVFFDKVLPFKQRTLKDNREIVIGYGPPGSGKTIVAQGLTVEAISTGSDVTILVPTQHLKDEYLRMVESAGIDINKPEEPEMGKVRIYEFSEYFSMLSGVPTCFSRESYLRSWWDQQLLNPKIRGRLKGISKTELNSRLPILIDALLEDDDYWKISNTSLQSKDRLKDQITEYEIIREVRAPLLDLLPEDPTWRTRAGLACEASKNRSNQAVSDVNIGVTSNALIIVDEAQDLAPSEWKELLSKWLSFSETNIESKNKIVLLGDEEQRISLIPFSWTQIKQFALNELKIPKDNIIEEVVDTASYRMRQTIARVARSVWRREHTDGGKYRRPTEFDYEKLLEGGRVDVFIRPYCDSIVEILNSSIKDSLANEHLFLVKGGGLPSFDKSDSILEYSIRTAKGLEADSVLVAYPFGRRAGRSRKILPHDEIMDFYVATSRAREKLTLIIDPLDWNELNQVEDVWRLPGVTVCVDKNLEKTDNLTELIRNTLVKLSDEERREAYEKKLEVLCQAPAAPPKDLAKELQKNLRMLIQSCDENTISFLRDQSRVLARQDRAVLSELWRNATIDLQDNQIDLAIGELLLAGEFAVAARVQLSCTEINTSKSCWDSEWIALIADESPLQQNRRKLINNTYPLMTTTSAVNFEIKTLLLNKFTDIKQQISKDKLNV